VELCGGGVEESVAFGLVAIELSDLLFVDTGKERDPICEYALSEFLYV
jgi:hypothetical protein